MERLNYKSFYAEIDRIAKIAKRVKDRYLVYIDERSRVSFCSIRPNAKFKILAYMLCIIDKGGEIVYC